jgi:hypothetical protein
MRFSLAQFLLIVPAYVLGMYAAALLQSTGLVHYKFQRAINRTQLIADMIQFSESTGSKKQFDEATINPWLAQRLPRSHQIWQQLREHPGVDPWGQPYRYIRNRHLTDGTVVELGVYSTGQDGVSETDGNDADDLNSWSEKQGQYYRDEISRQDFSDAALTGLLLTPFTYALLIGLSRLSRVTVSALKLKRPDKIAP